MARRKAPQSSLLKNNLTLNHIEPKTPAQEEFFNAYKKDTHHLLLGYAGTGKTLLALYKALTSLDAGEANKIIIFRPTKATVDQGFLPGTVEEKSAVYEAAYRSSVNKIMGRNDAYDLMKKVNAIQFLPTSYERGNTYDDAIIVIDEAQNCTAHELDTLITRTGKGSRLIICGDLLQQDLTRQSEKNVYKVLEILKNIPQFVFTHFGLEDIVRSGLVREFLMKKFTMFPNGY